MKEFAFRKFAALEPTVLQKNELCNSFYQGFSLLFNFFPRNTYFKEHI